jgi:hypothetical protein
MQKDLLRLLIKKKKKSRIVDPLPFFLPHPPKINAERGWLLMAMCLSAFPPSSKLYPYLLCYVTQHGYENYKAFCQRKLLLSFGRQTRAYAPTMLEWVSARQTATIAAEVRAYDGVAKHIPISSSLTAQEAGNLFASSRGIEMATGWTVAIQEKVASFFFFFFSFFWFGFLLVLLFLIFCFIFFFFFFLFSSSSLALRSWRAMPP